MGFEWDQVKDATNVAKHDISFEQATDVFEDPAHIARLIVRPELGELRWRATGKIGPDFITVIFTYRGEDVRIISARRASRDERVQYRQGSATS